MSSDLNSALAPPSLPEPSTSVEKRDTINDTVNDVVERPLAPAGASVSASELSLEKEVTEENGTANTIVNTGSEPLLTSNETNLLEAERDSASPNINDDVLPNKSAKMLSFFQRMAARGAEPKTSASSAAGVDENDLGPFNESIDTSLAITNVDTSSQKGAKFLSFLQQVGKHAQLGSSHENSELAGAFASWVGDQGPPTTLFDTFKRQSDLPLAHEQV